jgi:putative ABC transport system substrate-binding protein
VRRREFISLLGGAAINLPLAGRAQHAAMPVVGFLGTTTYNAVRLRAFLRGLQEAGYTEGKNVAVEYRWAETQADRLAPLALDLVRRRVSVIATSGNAAALAAKAATTTIPVIFSVSEDPVRLGLVASLARPGGNCTGINYLIAEVTAKRLELLRALVPGAVQIAVLVNPQAPVIETTLRELEGAAAATGLRMRVLSAGSSGEINAAFGTFVLERPNALFVSGGFLFSSLQVQLVHLAMRHAVPAAYADREYVEAGGLMSYGADLADSSRQVGIYTGRILKGMKPADLPVLQSTKLELVLNAETARTFGLIVPPSVLSIADEVIE